MFRFENYWVDMSGFQECVDNSWMKVSNKSYSSSIHVDKLKRSIRYDVNIWQVSLFHLKILVTNCNKVILSLNTLEEHRPLFRSRFNFWKIVKMHLDELLLAECNYWCKRGTIRWIKHGKDNTKLFHAMSTERFERNNIAMLKNEDGVEISNH
jgi:hypothetical protein